MSHNIDEIQLPSAKEAADREKLRFKTFVEFWASMSDEEIKLYPPFIQLTLAHRRELSKTYLFCEVKFEENFKQELNHINNLIKTSMGLL
ncbi:hypothetical protein [Chryseobacterium lathyri]|nr:hypothetical protein [Chryseobacterium lathyri]